MIQDAQTEVQLLQQDIGKADPVEDRSVEGKGDEAHLQRAYDLQ